MINISDNSKHIHAKKPKTYKETVQNYFLLCARAIESAWGGGGGSIICQTTNKNTNDFCILNK